MVVSEFPMVFSSSITLSGECSNDTLYMLVGIIMEMCLWHDIFRDYIGGANCRPNDQS